MLKAQGGKAPGGSKSYLSNGNLTLGYAFIAAPAEYGVTGRNTFMINNTGTVYQMDWGEKTVEFYESAMEYLPQEWPIPWSTAE